MDLDLDFDDVAGLQRPKGNQRLKRKIRYVICAISLCVVLYFNCMNVYFASSTLSVTFREGMLINGLALGLVLVVSIPTRIYLCIVDAIWRLLLCAVNLLTDAFVCFLRCCALLRSTLKASGQEVVEIVKANVEIWKEPVKKPKKSKSNAIANSGPQINDLMNETARQLKAIGEKLFNVAKSRLSKPQIDVDLVDGNAQVKDPDFVPPPPPPPPPPEPIKPSHAKVQARGPSTGFAQANVTLVPSTGRAQVDEGGPNSSVMSKYSLNIRKDFCDSKSCYDEARRQNPLQFDDGQEKTKGGRDYLAYDARQHKLRVGNGRVLMTLPPTRTPALDGLIDRSDALKNIMCEVMSAINHKLRLIPNSTMLYPTCLAALEEQQQPEEELVEEQTEQKPVWNFKSLMAFLLIVGYSVVGFQMISSNTAHLPHIMSALFLLKLLVGSKTCKAYCGSDDFKLKKLLIRTSVIFSILVSLYHTFGCWKNGRELLSSGRLAGYALAAGSFAFCNFARDVRSVI